MTTKTNELRTINVKNAKNEESEEKMVWFMGKEQFKNSGAKADVSMVVTKKTAKTDTHYSFTFRNSTGSKFGSRIRFGVKGNRIYFKSVGENEGYALQTEERLNGNVHGYFKIRRSELTDKVDLDSFAGNYALEYDRKARMYYIEKK